MLWREVRTWAYGRRIVLVRLAYVVLFALGVWATHRLAHGSGAPGRISPAVAVAPLWVLSLMLVNALSVTSITTERDGRAIDLLLVTDLSAKEIVFGKLGGTLYNSKEAILLPLLLCGYLWQAGDVSGENAIYLAAGLIVMNLFVAVLGYHCGMMYENSRTAIAVSLGTLFFLLVGVATLEAILVAFSDPRGSSFQVQLAPFLGVMVGGGVGLYFALGAKSPSAAIGWAALVCPFATFWAITSYFLGYSLAILLATAGAYGFATLTMLIPAIYEFDLATGRTTAEN